MINTKKIVLASILFSIVSVSAQRRFYPSLSNLVELEEQSSFPKDLQYIKSWYDETIDYIFYRDFQFSNSARNSASFKSMGLIIRGKNEFEFDRSGFKIAFDTDPNNNIAPINITNEHSWHGLDYGIDIQLDTYDPEDDFLSFLIIQRISSISETESIANFINKFTEPDEAKDQASLHKFISDVNSANDLNMTLTEEEMNLEQIAERIKSEMGPDDSLSKVLYNTYIKENTVDKTRANANNYFRSITNSTVSRTLSKTIFPKGEINFLERNTRIHLPKKRFKYIDQFKKEQVSIYVRKIEYDLNYEFKNQRYIFTLKLYPFYDNGLKENFTFKYRYHNVLKGGKEITDRYDMEKENLEFIELTFYPDYFSTSLYTRDDQILNFYKNFKAH